MIGLFFSGLLIFLLRMVDITLYTMRLLMVVRGRKALAWLVGFCQAFVFVVVLRLVLSDLSSWVKVVGYAAGFATGMVIGMTLESRLAMGYTHLRIISSAYGNKIAEDLRLEGYGVTEISAHGKDGAVTLLSCMVRRRYASKAVRLVKGIDPDAFITAEAVRSVQHGFWPIPTLASSNRHTT